MAVLLSRPLPRPSPPGCVHGACGVISALEGVEQREIRGECLFGDHVADEHEKNLVRHFGVRLPDLAHLVDPLLRRLLRVGQEVGRLPCLLLVQEQTLVDLLLHKVLDLVHDVALARVHAPL